MLLVGASGGSVLTFGSPVSREARSILVLLNFHFTPGRTVHHKVDQLAGTHGRGHLETENEDQSELLKTETMCRSGLVEEILVYRNVDRRRHSSFAAVRVRNVDLHLSVSTDGR